MKAIKFIKTSFITLLIVTTPYLNLYAEEWPGKNDGYGAPRNIYLIEKSCGDFIRAEKKYNEKQTNDYLNYFYWMSGYLTGLNANLTKGGNVLGSTNAKRKDFMIMISSYCLNNPIVSFFNGVNVTLGELKTVDWQDNEY